jgi:hypothetical protein
MRPDDFTRREFMGVSEYLRPPLWLFPYLLRMPPTSLVLSARFITR